jgi:hypothetical protein
VTAVIDHEVWDDVRGRPGPSRWVVPVALAVSLLLVLATGAAVAHGLTKPGVYSPGWFSHWDARTSTAVSELDLANPSRTDVSLVSARLQLPDGSPVPFARVASFTPVTVPAGTSASPVDKSGSVVARVSLVIDCPAALAAGTGGVQLVLTTTGTWPQHEVVVAPPGIESCDLPGEAEPTTQDAGA